MNALDWYNEQIDGDKATYWRTEAADHHGLAGVSQAMHTVAHYMDDEIREALNGDEWADGIAGERDYLAAYCARHIDKFGDDFEIN